jgi:hypothetical protein
MVRRSPKERSESCPSQTLNCTRLGGVVSCTDEFRLSRTSATLNLIASVTRMVRPQRGSHRFTEEPVPAVSIDVTPNKAHHIRPLAIRNARSVETRALP